MDLYLYLLQKPTIDVKIAKNEFIPNWRTHFLFRYLYILLRLVPSLPVDIVYTLLFHSLDQVSLMGVNELFNGS